MHVLRRLIESYYSNPSCVISSSPYYLQKKDIDRFLEKFDEYKREKKLGKPPANSERAGSSAKNACSELHHHPLKSAQVFESML